MRGRAHATDRKWRQRTLVVPDGVFFFDFSFFLFFFFVSSFVLSFHFLARFPSRHESHCWRRVLARETYDLESVFSNRIDRPRSPHCIIPQANDRYKNTYEFYSPTLLFWRIIFALSDVDFMLQQLFWPVVFLHEKLTLRQQQPKINKIWLYGSSGMHMP